MNAIAAVDRARDIIQSAIARKIFPAATVEVGSASGPVWRDALGALSFDRAAPPTTLDTPFDLASLTKVLATATLLMELVLTKRLDLDERVEGFFEDWRTPDRDRVVLRDLLEHASGLAARLVDAPPEGRREFEHDIARMPLEYSPRAQSVYSDLGFILLGFVVADRGGAPLRELFARVIGRQLHVATLGFQLDDERRRLAAPTLPLPDDVRRGRRLVGEVHDNYAAALGGAAGHAGLFGTAPAVGAFARLILKALHGDRGLLPPFNPELVSLFTTKSAVPGSSRALGWDTMLSTSSCGAHMSAAAVGHVGFTGTSLWIDPVRDRYFVLLTNRTCDGGLVEDMRDVRRAFHDALADL